jgi:hypothetical protein
MIPKETLSEPSPALVLMVSDRFLMFFPDATEAPTLAIEHGMFLLQLQVIRDMKCAQVNFKSAFQNTDLQSFDIYMKPPKSLRLPDGYVLKLHRALYLF